MTGAGKDMHVEVRFFAGAAEAAGAESLSVAGVATVDALVDRLGEGNERLASVLLRFDQLPDVREIVSFL